MPCDHSGQSSAGGAAVSVNRRSATRHDVAIDVSVRLAEGTAAAGAPAIETTIENLSLTGAFLVLQRRLTIGSRVTLQFRIPTHDRPIETAAVVRWSNDQGAGLQFDGLRAAEVYALGKLFEKP